MREISTDIECKSLIDRLEEEKRSIKWMQKGVETMVLRRPKRGLWGTFLTSIFGVNDEVYKQIDDLDQNQKTLLQVSNRQTKVMLQSLAKFNDTEMRVSRKLDELKHKLDKGLEAVKDMEQWYRYGGPDTNKLEIHLLTIFDVQKSYLDELMRYYKSILNIATSKECLYELISPAKIKEIIHNAMRKLPSNIEIMQHPIVRTEIVRNDNITSVYCYFSIAEVTEFQLMKANPIPFKVENGVYCMFDVGTEIIAIDYNSQQYFELSDSELKKSVAIENQLYICSPSIIRNIEHNPNCIIDTLYERMENSSCPIVQRKFHNMIWKKLYTRNTWMFIAERRTKIAIICNGQREETYVEKTGIIAISQNCVISTKRSILTPKRLDTIPVVAGYSRPVVVNLTMSKTPAKTLITEEENEIQPYDNLNDLVSEEENIHTELQDTHWKQITHHSALMSGTTTILIIAVLIAIACGFKFVTRWRSTRRTSKRRERTIEEPENGTEMESLNRVETTDPLRDFKIPSLISN